MSTFDSQSIASPGADLDVLVVDDDACNVETIVAALEPLDARVALSHSGEHALEYLGRHDVAVVLLDVKSPGLDGFEVARLVRAEQSNKHVPIIFITGRSDENERIRRAYELGAVDYLLEPIMPEVLRAKVEVFVELRKRTVEIARQARRLRRIEKEAAIRQLREERRRWEAEELRWQVRHQRLLNDRLSESDRRKDEFIATLAHELRNPLVPLVLGLRMAAQGEVDGPAVPIGGMLRQVEHLQRLVDDLLDTARIRQGKLEMEFGPVDLRDVIGQAREMCRSSIDERHQSLVVDGPDQSVPLHGDRVRLTQVVCNLLSNASRYAEGDTTIMLRWGVGDGEAFIRVTDQGCGIGPEFLGRVFDTFAQERRERGGLGLGLALVRELVQRHRGTVTASSDGQGKGAEFEVRIPATRPDLRPREVSPPPPAELARVLRVVLIEDNADVRQVVGQLMHSWGHDVVGLAANGVQGVELVLRTRPDVVVVDIGLPDIDGYDVAQRIGRDLGTQRPGLVAMTGYSDHHDRARALDAGFDLHVVKPPEPDAFRSILQQAARTRASSLRVAASS